MEGAGAGEQQFGPQWTLPLRKVRQSILRFRNEMIRYRDQVEGTNVWKNVTANTVPKGLRHLDAHTEELDTELYKNVKETQRIVFNPRRAVKARRKELLRLMEWFEHYGMMPKLQRELLYNNGLKAVVYLGLIGGGHKVLQSNNKFGRSPFGTRISKAGRRAPNARLAAAGCRMLVGAAWSNPKIRRLANDLSVIAELLKLAKVHRRDIDVVLPALNALKFFAHGRGKHMGPIKAKVLGPDRGALVLCKILDSHPLDLRVKRVAAEFAAAMVTGGPGSWKHEAKTALRDANVTTALSHLLYSPTHTIGSRKVVERALESLRLRLFPPHQFPAGDPWASFEDKRAPLDKRTIKKLRAEGKLPQHGGGGRAEEVDDAGPSVAARCSSKTLFDPTPESARDSARKRRLSRKRKKQRIAQGGGWAPFGPRPERTTQAPLDIDRAGTVAEGIEQ